MYLFFPSINLEKDTLRCKQLFSVDSFKFTKKFTAQNLKMSQIYGKKKKKNAIYFSTRVRRVAAPNLPSKDLIFAELSML